MLQSSPTPTWLSEEAGGDANQPLKSSDVSSNNSPVRTPEQEQKAKILYWGLKIGTMSLSLLMAATACIGLGSIAGVDKSGKFFVGSYMFFFAVLLFTFEGVSLIPESPFKQQIDHLFKRNFGFMYNCMGKSFFIIFIAFLSFGLGDPVSLTLFTGLSLAAFGACELALYLKYPELFD
jgi:hypothetical protein